MKPTSTLTILFSSLLLILPELCSSQQRRSKVSATQSVSQVIDFDCPEEFGYYPHPGDCTQYYVCVFGGALLESCTGGLMYSHELQTCDWPRNVGCGGESIEGATVSTVRVTDPRTRQTPPPQTFSRATASQRQPIQREELAVQKQHQLYAEEDLGPAEEIESDRQQRVYRGQPSTLGQVARDRDGLSRHSNALQIPQVSPGTGREKLSVVSFGTQQQYSRQSASPASYQEPPASSKGSSRTYNSSQYNPSHYDSFYSLYDEEPEIYKDIEYTQYTAQNSNNQQPAQQQSQQQQQQQYRPQSYKEKQQQQQPVAIAQKVQLEQQQATQQQRYSQQPSYNAQDIYGQSLSQDYNDNYSLQNDDIQYKQQAAIQGKSSANRLQQVASTTASQPASESRSTNAPAPIGLKVIDATPSPSTLAPSTTRLPDSTNNGRRLTLSAAFSLETSDPPVVPSKRILTPSSNRGSYKSYTVDDPKTINDGFISAFIKDYIDDESTFGLTLKQIAAENSEKKKTEPSSQYKFEQISTEGSTSTTTQIPSRVIANDRLNLPSVVPASRAVENPFSVVEPSSRTQKQKNYFEFSSENEKPSSTETAHRSRNSFRIVVDPTQSAPEAEEVTVNDKSILRQIKVTNIRSRVMTNHNPTDDSSSNERTSNEDQSQSYSSETNSNEGLSSTSRNRYRIRTRPEEDVNVRSTYSAPVFSTTTPQSRSIPPSSSNRFRNGYDEEPRVSLIRQTTTTTTTTTTQESVPRIRAKSEYVREFDNSEPTYRLNKEDTTTSNIRKLTNSIEFIPISSEANVKQFEEINENSNEEVFDEKLKTQNPSRSRTSSRFNPSSRFQASAPESTNDITDIPRNPDPVNRGRGTSTPSRCPQGLDNQSECNEKPTVRVRPAVPSTETPSTTPASSPGLSRGGGRTRGSATYTISPNEAEPNRGTPATVGRAARPTLKPSTAIVSKAQEYIDIFRYPPRRPDPIYPTPQVDKTAAKCRKDVCLLPDCSCGGKEIPGDLTPEEAPQIVLLTFDDSINDLNKGLYSDLFEKGRTNPNGCPISATFYVSHEWTDYSQVQNLYAAGHEMASHSVSHSFGEQFSQKKWLREIGGQREILSAYGGVRLEDIRGMRAPFLAVGGNKMFKMLYDGNFTYDSSMPVYENKPPSWPYTLDYKIFHDCMIPPCPTRSYPGVWEVPMVMWQDLNGGRCSMGDACSNPPTADGVYKMLIKNFERHFTSNRAPFGLFYHAAWFTQPHHKEGFIAFLDTIVNMPEVWLVSNWQAVQWVRDPTPINRLNNFAPFQCNYPERPRKCNNPKVCNLWHKSGVRYMRTCQPCPEIYPWTGKTGIRNSRVDNEIVQE